MRIDELEFVYLLDIYKKLQKNDKIIYSYFEKCDCISKSGWFYKSIKELSILHSICQTSISRSKQRLIYYGLIQIKKHYNYNGHRGIDYIRVNSLQEIYKHLNKDVSNFKDQNRVLNSLKFIEPKLTKTT